MFDFWHCRQMPVLFLVPIILPPIVLTGFLGLPVDCRINKHYKIASDIANVLIVCSAMIAEGVSIPVYSRCNPGAISQRACYILQHDR